MKALTRSAPAARADPRIAQTKAVVLAATFALIAESGFAGATVERIAERSGVARSSIYRHWPNPLPALHLESLAPLRQRPEDRPPTEDVAHDLVAYLEHVVNRLNDPAYAAVSLALLAVANTDPTYARAHRELLASRTQILARTLRRAIVEHVLCACTDVDLETRMLLAPLTHIRFVEHRTLPATLAARLVDRLVLASAPNGPQCTCPPKKRTRRND